MISSTIGGKSKNRIPTVVNEDTFGELKITDRPETRDPLAQAASLDGERVLADRREKVKESIIDVILHYAETPITRTDLADGIGLMAEVLTEASYPLETQPDEQIKNNLLSASYLASPEEKTQVDFSEASYPASPVEKIEAD